MFVAIETTIKQFKSKRGRKRENNLRFLMNENEDEYIKEIQQRIDKV